MRICVLGGDGYCGWATALYLSEKGHEVTIVDNYIRRQWDHELGAQTLTPILPLAERLTIWKSLPGRKIDLHVGDVADHEFLSSMIASVLPPLARAMLVLTAILLVALTAWWIAHDGAAH